MGWNPIIAAQKLAQHVGPKIWDETRAKLESLATGEFGKEAAHIALNALVRQHEIDNEKKGYTAEDALNDYYDNR